MTKRMYSKSPTTDCAEAVREFSKQGRVCKIEDYAEAAGLTRDGARHRLKLATNEGLVVVRKVKIGLGRARSYFVAKGYEELFLQLNSDARAASEAELRMHKHRFATMQLRAGC